MLHIKKENTHFFNFYFLKKLIVYCDLKGLAMIFWLVRKTHLSSSEAMKYTYNSKQI